MVEALTHTARWGRAGRTEIALGVHALLDRPRDVDLSRSVSQRRVRRPIDTMGACDAR